MKTIVLATASAVALAGCGGPLAGVEKLSDVPLAENQPARGAVAAPEEIGRKGGFFGGLFRGTARGEHAAPDAEIAAAPAADDTVEGSAAADTLGTRPEPDRRGFLGRLFNSDDKAPDGTQTASLGADARGTFGRGSGATRAVQPDDKADDVAYGAFLPFGTVGRVCDAHNRPKGVRVERSDAGYDIYDTAPGTTNPRTFYVTGFADSCPRQFTAALAMFGAPSMHELLRYGLPSDEYPYSETDRAYEKVKSAICRVGRRKPCGNRIGSLERNTVFISTYEHFTYNGRWADILVHDGAVLAASLKDP